MRPTVLAFLGLNRSLVLAAPHRERILRNCAIGWAVLFALVSTTRGETNNLPKKLTADLGGDVKLELTLIPAGSFMMGEDKHDCNKPGHKVTITRPFYLGTYHVTRGQFQKFVDQTGYKTDAERHDPAGTATRWPSPLGRGWNPEKKVFENSSRFSWRNAGFEQTDEHPVLNVSWNDAIAFCEWLSKKENKAFGLPSEAEWEYACRAGTTTYYYSGDDPKTLAQVGNVPDAAFKSTTSRTFGVIAASDGYAFTAPVGRFKPNAFGLYDMHGNVCQLCADWYGKYSAEPAIDPAGPEKGDDRILRGGAFDGDPEMNGSAARFGTPPRFPGRGNISQGFRVYHGPGKKKVAVPLQASDSSTPRAPVAGLSPAEREVSKSADRTEPFTEVEKRRAAAVKDSLVLLSRKENSYWTSMAGFVYRHDQQRGYIIVDARGRLQLKATVEQLKEPDTPEGLWNLTWGAGKQSRQAVAREFARPLDEFKRIYVAPVKDLPLPITVGSQDGVQTQTPVEVIGYRIVRPEASESAISLPLSTDFKPKLVPAQISGMISRVHRAAQTPQFFMVEGDAVGGVAIGLVLDRGGAVLGLADGNENLKRTNRWGGFDSAEGTEAERKNSKRFMKTLLPTVLQTWERPQAYCHGIRAVSGDFENVKLEVVLILEDPFDRVDQLNLSMKVVPPVGVWNPPKDDLHRSSFEVQLTKRQPAPAVAKQFFGTPPSRTPWVGELTIPNPLNRTVSFRGMLDYKTKSGKTVELQQYAWEFKFSENVPPGSLPDIPGADGRPLVIYAFKKHPNGGMQVTSSQTKSKASPPAVEHGNFPKPTATGTKVAGEPVKADDFEKLAMPFEPAKNLGDLATFTPDGKWFYLVDMDNVLRKISTETWTETATLSLGEVPNALSLSAAGLAVSFFASNRVWVIDSKTLTIERELPFEKPWNLAGSPANSLGVVLHNSEPQPRDIKYMQLSLVDFATGKRLHEIQFSYLNLERQISASSDVEFRAEPLLLKFTPDGRHLFSVYSRVTRFRLEDGELIYEQASDPLIQDSHDRAVLSPNGKLITMYGSGRGVIRRAPSPILDAKDLNKAVRTLKPEGTSQIGVVGLGVEHSFVCGLDGGMFVFGPDGNPLHQAPFPDHEFLHRIIADPAGDRFVTWHFGKPITVWTYVGAAK